MNPADSEDALSGVIAALRGADRVAIDTEADSLHCYQEKLCLIQLSCPAGDFLVDPLAGCSMVPLYEELGRHPLVFHGGDYDLRLFRRVGFVPTIPLFDTMLAARLVGMQQFSLAALVEAFFDVSLSKGSQKANWGKRPLTLTMIEYAMNDTRYLLEIADRLREKLAGLGRLEWLAQSCERLVESASADPAAKDGREPWRIQGSGKLRGRAAAILRELWAWRDAEAARIDRPPFHVMHNEALIRWAESFDATGDADPPHLRGGRRERFFAAAKRAMEMPREEWPTFPKTHRLRATPEQERRIAAIKSHRDRIAKDLALDPSVIASRNTIEQIVYGTATPDILMPWQRELLGLG